jgi:hypothetical protein
VTGLVSFWHKQRRFGRIVGDDDVVYWSRKELLRSRHALTVGDSVRFKPTDHAKGPRAVDVYVVEVPPRGRRRRGPERAAPPPDPQG